MATPSGVPYQSITPARPRGAVILLSEGSGIDAALLEFAQRLRRAGYAVALPDLWWRDPPQPGDPPRDVAAAVAAVRDTDALQDIRAVRAALVPNGRVFVVGFCLGGLYARMAACAVPGLAGAVEFYGRLVYPNISPTKPVQPLDLLPGLACPLQCHFGDADPSCPPSHVDELERRLASRTQPSQVFRYPGCGHGFLNPARPEFRAGRAATAWARAVNFLDQLNGA